MHLVDTSVWVELLRGRDTPATRLLRWLLVEDTTLVAPVIVQEILQGARGEPELTRLRTHFTALPWVEATLSTHAQAGALYARARWQGITIRSPHDCLIAVLAVEHGVPLLTVDREFETVARVEPRLVLADPAAR